MSDELYLDRSKVRGIILRSQEIGGEVTQSLLMQVDHLPIVTADDMRGPAATASTDHQIERAAEAICLWDGGEWNGVLGSRECSRTRYRDMAREALAAAATAGSVGSMREIFSAVDEHDWQRLFSYIPASGHGKFWTAIFDQVYASLSRPEPAATPTSPVAGRELVIASQQELFALREWKAAILGKCKASDGFDALEWGGDKEGWGFVHYFIGHLETRALHPEPAAIPTRAAKTQGYNLVTGERDNQETDDTYFHDAATPTRLEGTLLDISAVHWNALRHVIDWWDSLPPSLRQDIEGSGNEPGAIAIARKALPYAPVSRPVQARTEKTGEGQS